MAFWPSSALLMVTKPKPRGRLVSRSMMRLVSETVPYFEKRLFRSCSVVWKERFPTYNFILFLFSGFEVATSRQLLKSMQSMLEIPLGANRDNLRHYYLASEGSD